MRHTHAYHPPKTPQTRTVLKYIGSVTVNPSETSPTVELAVDYDQIAQANIRFTSQEDLAGFATSLCNKLESVGVSQSAHNQVSFAHDDAKGFVFTVPIEPTAIAKAIAFKAEFDKTRQTSLAHHA